MALALLATYRGSWNARTAAHLLRRAGFGCSKSEVDRAVAQGLAATVDGLFDEAADQEAEFQETFERLLGSLLVTAPGDLEELKAWWCYRMIRTRAPLREKLTLFWHGHFATSYSKLADAQLMFQQMETLRSLAWGSFPDLTLAIAKNPAMIAYLDGDSNTKEHPNENFARELMELFTCGIGNYTERDVLAAARAFTGWHRNGYEFFFNADAHDDGIKRLLGRAGTFDGADVVDLLMQHPATPRFIGRKLLRFFAAPNPRAEAVEEAAARLRETGYSIQDLLRTLFTSQYFYSPECIRTRIASPAEFVIGTVRMLGCRMSARQLHYYMTTMGQEIFAPPNVKGWDGEEKWINSSTWAARIAFAQAVSQLEGSSNLDAHLPIDQVVASDQKEPRQIISALTAALGEDAPSSQLRNDLNEILLTGDQGSGSQMMQMMRDDDYLRSRQVRKVLGVLLSLPELQRC